MVIAAVLCVQSLTRHPVAELSQLSSRAAATCGDDRATSSNSSSADSPRCFSHAVLCKSLPLATAHAPYMYEAARHVRQFHRAAVQAAGRQSGVVQHLMSEVARVRAVNTSSPGCLRVVWAQPTHRGQLYIGNRGEVMQWCR
jgi:hypothetical protein